MNTTFSTIGGCDAQSPNSENLISTEEYLLCLVLIN